jgi:ABC-type bacteriocin/lantibiotic exporter with double-glycine peptidase domain
MAGRNLNGLSGTAALLVLLSLCGCASPYAFYGLKIDEPTTLITAVPPLLQDRRFSCGATCLIVLAGYWEQDASWMITNCPAYLAEDLTAQDLKALAGQFRLEAYAYVGSMQDLEHQIQQGRPVITLIPAPDYEDIPPISINRIRLSAVVRRFQATKAHWVIVIGCSKDSIILHDPAFGRLRVSRRLFEHWWEHSRFTCVVVAPKL